MEKQQSLLEVCFLRKKIDKIAINAAVERGMTCVVAAGNSGIEGINAPADAFYVIAVGSVTSSGDVYFSN